MLVGLEHYLAYSNTSNAMVTLKSDHLQLENCLGKTKIQFRTTWLGFNLLPIVAIHICTLTALIDVSSTLKLLWLAASNVVKFVFWIARKNINTSMSGNFWAHCFCNCTRTSSSYTLVFNWCTVFANRLLRSFDQIIFFCPGALLLLNLTC